MLLDANILLHATDAGSAQHQPAASLLTSLMNGTRRVALPWQTIGAFVRISTNPRVYVNPATGPEAWAWVEGWLACDVTWIPPATEATARVYGQLTGQLSVTGNLVPDAMLAALAMEHGLELWSTDTDFARFPGLRWRNLLTNG
jgi:uncharacterized protein